MLKNYFKIAVRNIMRHKGYAAINIVGLAVSIAACLLIFVIIHFESGFDSFQPKFKNIYRLISHTEMKGGEQDNFESGTPHPALDALRIDMPDIKIGALHTTYGSQVTVPTGDGSVESANKKFIETTGTMFMEPQFFDIFSYTWLAGTPSVLAQPGMAVLDKSTATKYFGDWKTAMVRSLTLDNAIPLKVAGIVDDAPLNSDFILHVLVSYTSLKSNGTPYYYSPNWGSTTSNHQVFVLLPPGIFIDQVNARLNTLSKKYYQDQGRGQKIHTIQPLSDLHYDDKYGVTLGDHITTKATLWTLTLIGLLIILMASINFINLSTAQGVGRSKEVGIRKVLGSSRAQLVAQVMGETGLIVLLSVCIAIGIALLALPSLKYVADVPPEIGLFTPSSLAFLIIVTVIVTLLSGLYPAAVLSGFNPSAALKSKIGARTIGGISLRRILVITQFSISQVLIICTIVAIGQMSFIRNANLGFKKEAVLVMPGYADSISLQKMDAFKQTLLQNPSVSSVTFASDVPSSDNNSSSNFYFDHAKDDVDFNMFLKVADADYFKTFGLELAAGRTYEQSDTARELVVNETLVKKLGFKRSEDIIGKDIMIRKKWLPIVGVVKDFKANSLREAQKPIILFPSKKMESVAAVKLRSANLSKDAAAIQALWEKTYPEYAYNGSFFEESIENFYRQEKQLALIYKLFAGLAILISCLGLYGLVSFMTTQKTKEVGIRKVLGASVSSLVYMFSKEFTLLIFIALIIAIPAGYFFISRWLQNFAYRIDVGLTVFIVTALASILIAWITVSYKAVRAALANPVKSLRSE